MAHWTLEEPPIHSVVLDTLEALEQVAGSVPWRLMFSNMALRCEELEQRADGDAVSRCRGSHRLILDAKVCACVCVCVECVCVCRTCVCV